MDEDSKAFKHRIGEKLVSRLATATRLAWPEFNEKAFLHAVCKQLSPLELKARVALVTQEWARFLPSDYPAALQIVLATLGPPLEQDEGVSSGFFYHWFHGHYVETRGLQHLDLSLAAMVQITQRSTAEYCVRPFLQQQPQRVLAFMAQQRTHESPHVRRWVSEGTRPRLPWGLRLNEFILDPHPVLQLISPLRKDPSAYVRNSVANNLNDIAKDHPELVVETARAWLAEKDNSHADWIAKRALRHLVKQGHEGALAALGFAAGSRVGLLAFALDRPVVNVGESVTMEITLLGGASERISLDYAVGYQLAQGKSGSKVFKLKAFDMRDGQRLTIRKTHSFRPITTRTYYGGPHTITLLANGAALGTAEFTLHVPESSRG